MEQTRTFNLYKDIRERTGGEIYIGVAGPVRTGKSTFIKRFMDVCVLPNITDEHTRTRATDELPQSAAGKTIMTTEPKFIPKEAATITLPDNSDVKIRLIDCVGYMTNGATGHMEEGSERLVKTPWFDYEIPFTQAATIGTKKVITDHSTIGIVITSDGSFGEFSREDYIPAEEQTINELLSLNKPFIVLLNSAKPMADETRLLADEISAKHEVTVLPVNCSTLKEKDITEILEKCLLEFPVTKLNIYIPKWIDILENDHWLKSDIINTIKDKVLNIRRMNQVNKDTLNCESQYITGMNISSKNYSNGCADIYIDVDSKYYYEIISELSGSDIKNEYQLVNTLKELSFMKNEYAQIKDAFESVKAKGYGVVTPSRDEISLDEPEVFKNGVKYGVKIKATAPSIHMIKADVMTEIAPIVGNEQQAKDLIQFIKDNEVSEDDGIWNTNIFGKTIDQIVNDGIRDKLEKMSADTQSKMQDTLQKITNDSKGGVICIII